MRNEEIEKAIEQAIGEYDAHDIPEFRTALYAAARALVAQAYDEAAQTADEADCGTGHCCTCGYKASLDIRALKDSLSVETVST